jgi:hypothetical protein
MPAPYIVRQGEDADLGALTATSLVVAATAVTNTTVTLGDDTLITLGASADVTLEWATAPTPDEFQILPLADDYVLRFGKAAATQLSWDLVWMGGTTNGTATVLFDASANLADFNGVSLRLQDTDTLTLGDSDDVTLQWNATLLALAPSTDDYVFTIGVPNATQKSFDVKIYGNAANGADYLFWDASGSIFYAVGAAVIAGPVNDANGHGLRLTTKTATGDPGTTGAVLGDVCWNTFDKTIMVFDGSNWLATGALT